MTILEEPTNQKTLENTIDLGYRSGYLKYYTVEAPNILCELWKLCYPGKTLRFESKQLTTLILIVSDLYSCYRSGYDFVRYSRNKNDYISDGLSYSIIIKIIDTLINNGYVIDFKGFRNAKMSRTSRIKATEELITRIENEYLPQSKTIVPSEDDNYVILKGFKEQIEGRKKKIAQIISFEQTDTTKTWNNFLFQYNTFLSTTNITLGDEYVPKEKINFDRTRLYRSFNDESFTSGGRLYGPWFQNCSKEARQHILIDGVSTVEVDYSCLHPTLAYALNGIDVSGKDLYAVDTIENYQDHRKLIKKVVNICLNAKTKKSAIGAINNESLKHPKYSSTELVNLCTSYHSKISKTFFSDSGKRFMFEDSEIALEILKYYTKQNILVLPIHDSFIVQKEHENNLKKYMIETFISKTGKSISVESKDLNSNNINNFNNLSPFSSISSSPQEPSILSITKSLFEEPVTEVLPKDVFLLTKSDFTDKKEDVFLLTKSDFTDKKEDVFLLTDTLFTQKEDNKPNLLTNGDFTEDDEKPNLLTNGDFTHKKDNNQNLLTNGDFDNTSAITNSDFKPAMSDTIICNEPHFGFFATDEQPTKENNMSLREIYEKQSLKCQYALKQETREKMEQILRKIASNPSFFPESCWPEIPEEVEDTTPETDKERIQREDREWFEELLRNEYKKPEIIEEVKIQAPRYLDKMEK